MSKLYRVATDEEKRDVCCEDYDLLIGPCGFECFLGEPEDRIWRRDGKQAVERLNELDAALREIATSEIPASENAGEMVHQRATYKLRAIAREAIGMDETR